MRRVPVWWIDFKFFIEQHVAWVVVAIAIPIVWFLIPRVVFFIALVRMHQDDNYTVTLSNPNQTITAYGNLFRLENALGEFELQYVEETQTLYHIVDLGEVAYLYPFDEINPNIDTHFDWEILLHIKKRDGVYIVDDFRDDLEGMGYEIENFRFVSFCRISVERTSIFDWSDNPNPLEPTPDGEPDNALADLFHRNSYSCTPEESYTDYGDSHIIPHENILDLEASEEIVDLIELYGYVPWFVNDDTFAFINPLNERQMECSLETAYCVLALNRSTTYLYNINEQALYYNTGYVVANPSLYSDLELDDMYPIIDLMYDILKGRTVT